MKRSWKIDRLKAYTREWFFEIRPYFALRVDGTESNDWVSIRLRRSVYRVARKPKDERGVDNCFYQIWAEWLRYHGLEQLSRSPRAYQRRYAERCIVRHLREMRERNREVKDARREASLLRSDGKLLGARG